MYKFRNNIHKISAIALSLLYLCSPISAFASTYGSGTYQNNNYNGTNATTPTTNTPTTTGTQNTTTNKPTRTPSPTSTNGTPTTSDNTQNTPEPATGTDTNNPTPGNTQTDTNQPGTPLSQETPKKSSALNIILLVGGIVLTVFGVGIIFFIVYRRRKAKNTYFNTPQPPTFPPTTVG